MYVRVRVSANAKKESLEVINNEHLVISVKEKAQQNMANKKVTTLIAGYFGVPLGTVRLIHGHHSPSKLFSIPDQ
jgi:uncharacterized protein YggU (UPF0235/DUF167 family)